MDMIVKKILDIVAVVTFGLIVFVVTFIVLEDLGKVNSVNAKTVILESDSCYLDKPEGLSILDSCEGILLYVETEPCAACIESAIMQVVNSITDSCGIKRPLMIFHPVTKCDQKTINEYHKRFDERIGLIITVEDSIMIKNPWIPKYMGFYGIVTDSLSRVLYAGSLFDPDFLVCCKKQSGKTENAL